MSECSDEASIECIGMKLKKLTLDSAKTMEYRNIPINSYSNKSEFEKNILIF